MDGSWHAGMEEDDQNERRGEAKIVEEKEWRKGESPRQDLLEVEGERREILKP